MLNKIKLKLNSIMLDMNFNLGNQVILLSKIIYMEKLKNSLINS